MTVGRAAPAGDGASEGLGLGIGPKANRVGFLLQVTGTNLCVEIGTAAEAERTTQKVPAVGESMRYRN